MKEASNVLLKEIAKEWVAIMVSQLEPSLAFEDFALNEEEIDYIQKEVHRIAKRIAKSMKTPVSGYYDARSIALHHLSKEFDLE